MPLDFSGAGPLEMLAAMPKAWRAKREAQQLTDNLEGWADNGYGDAARHAIASGLLARRTSPDIAKAYGWLNERVYPALFRLAFSPDDPRETGMDYANEDFAINLAPHFPSDEAFAQYILDWPEKRKPQSVPGTLQWFGKARARR